MEENRCLEEQTHRGIKEKFDQTVQKAYETFMHQQTDLDEEPEEAEELEQEEGGMNMGM